MINNKTANTTSIITTTRQRPQQTTKDNDNDNSTGADKVCSGAKPMFSFLDALSPEDRALFEEHVREDDVDMPPCSGAQQTTSTAVAGNVTNTTIAPSNRLTCPDSGEGRSQRKKRKRRARLPPLPPAGHPGGYDDPRRREMSGACFKWYLRHLQDGRTPEEAEQMARNRIRDSAASKARKARNNAFVNKRRSGTWIRDPVIAEIEKTAPPKTHTMKRKSEHTTPQEPPNTKRQKVDYVQVAEGLLSAPNPPRVAERQRRCPDALKGIYMAVLPLNYPVETMGAEELTALQDLLMEEIYRGCGYPVSFHGVHFKGGILQVDCKDERSANWLREITPKLEGWKGPVLCAKRGEDIPPMHSMTVFLPRCADKPFEFALGLVRNQNEGISISAWRVVYSKLEDSGWRLNICIDDESYKFIRKQGFRINYRFSSVVMRPYRSKTTKESERDEKMLVNEDATETKDGVDKDQYLIKQIL
ncbi:PREDICTED: uncharacterized protein LOC108977476 isoform X1 [Bactrocera latifrons]|uniref:DUF4780 domain-containing protein n=1 Tax=Bactrocera latifrons TaxID=174628 RepID=A0A0K8U534_BACLA|nr:PREDICTED: uncharacterized protein LOC108977476 isoform X1 [Bactrocera latifrons]XP_018802719.1 PREDICTED: uncharacterized protein LOC108977476 isoform X1 [Bactrocera latifrons]XP_018802720.1 PREDICTED: uncharacterized protein LOC108977476 isoform X1 [Bactrocera latifrons]